MLAIKCVPIDWICSDSHIQIHFGDDANYIVLHGPNQIECSATQNTVRFVFKCNKYWAKTSPLFSLQHGSIIISFIETQHTNFVDHIDWLDKYGIYAKTWNSVAFQWMPVIYLVWDVLDQNSYRRKNQNVICLAFRFCWKLFFQCFQSVSNGRWRLSFQTRTSVEWE